MVELRPRTPKTVAKAPTKPVKQRTTKKILQTFVAKDDDIDLEIPFPTTEQERKDYVNPKTKRAVPPFHYKVFDLCSQIPRGHVSTYKAISDALNAGPRAVGQALRNNPFCPLPVPCHRVIASDFSIGGFSGGWGDCQFVADKKAKLMKEGCKFNEHYQFVSNIDGKKAIFTDFKV
ncbi:6-O-methylguanine DNA methyltransferase [Fennellomyces sp. T-0311]|nr:6-O-methylguanine DNA methyltransferase [Fennellomyces sp. T-0311]